METPTSVYFAAFFGFLAALPLGLFNALLLAVSLKDSVSIFSWESPGQPFVSLFSVALVMFVMVLAVGLGGGKEWARHLAVRAFGPCAVALSLFTLLEDTRIPTTHGGSLLVIGQGLDVALDGVGTLALIPIALWWTILFTRPTIRRFFFEASLARNASHPKKSVDGVETKSQGKTVSGNFRM
jgi:hypothetical protein